MYTPRHFAAREAEHARRIISAHPFATLITSPLAGALQITLLPLLLEGDFLYGHVAKPNPHWQAFAQGHTLALFQGPHQYISPRWYETPAEHVPTWNYISVQVHGQPEVLDAAGARGVVERLTAYYEQGQWSAQPDKLERLLPGIVAFRLPLTRIEAKFKMSQNRSAADRAGVMQALHRSGRAEDAAVAEWMSLSND